MKYGCPPSTTFKEVSPPSRGAWIEMGYTVGVIAVKLGRPPRGGRGLKFVGRAGGAGVDGSPPLAGGVD